MPSIDERVVAMAFENLVFETRVSQTITTLGKLDTAIKNIGSTRGLDEIERSANKVTLQQPMSALDKLRAKLSGAGDGASRGMSEIERASQKVQLEGPSSALDKLRAKFTRGVTPEAVNSFSEIEKSASRVSLEGITRAIDGAASKFSVLTGAAAVAFGNIASQAAMKGLNFAKSFGIGPVIDGLHEYQTNLQSIQTIQANTDRPLTEVNASLQELNKYSDQTIYNFSEMAKNIGTFTAAGVDLKTATSSIKGIANMAALSGSSSQQAATAMYQLSQAISSGKVGLQDWNSVVNAGMGGKKLQTALATTAVAMGDISGKSVKLEGPLKKLTINGESFRESIMAKPGEKPWLSSEILVNTLATLDGRFSHAALSAELTKNGLKKYTEAEIEAKIATSRHALELKNGVKYTDAQFKSLMHLSDSAFKSATEVKTLGQVFDVAKETIGSGWAASFQNIFGNLTEAKKLFTGMSNTINGFINASSLARNELLAGWKELGGRADLIQGIKNIFNVLFDVLGKVGHAFREIFPAKTSKDLADMSRRFLVFTAHLNNSPEVIDNIARTFKGFFAVLHIGFSIIKGVAGVILDLLGVVGKGGGGFLSFTGGIGDFLVAVDKALTQGGLLKGFFEILTNVLKQPLNMIMDLASAFMGIFGFADQGEEFGKKVGDAMGGLPAALAPLKPYLDKAAQAWQGFLDILKKVAAFLDPWVEKFKTIASDVTNAIADSFTQVNFDNVIKAIQTGLLGGLFVEIRKLMSGGVGVDIGGGFLKQMSGTFKALTGNLEAMQKNVQAGTLLKIASALGLLAGAAYIFSTIPADKLAKALGAMVIAMGQLVAVMAVMTKVTGGKGFLAVPAMATSLLILAAAMVVLGAAVKIFATMSWDELARGLAGIGGGLLILGVAFKFMPPGAFVQGAVLIAFAVGLNLIAAAVKQFAGLKWEELGKGLLGIAVGMGLMVGAMLLMPPNMAASGLALLAMSFGVTVLAGAIAAMGKLDVKTIAKGIGGIALSMMALAWAITGFPPTLALQAAGLVILGVALSGIAGAVGLMGKLSIWTLVKGLAAMGIALTELAVGLYLMIGSAPGAVALLAAAAAFAVLGPALAVMGNLEWTTILKGLATMALTMGLLAAAGLILAAPLALIGAALLVLGIGLVPVALSAMLLAKAFQILGEEGAKGVAVLIAAVGLFIAAIPKMIVGFLQGIGDVLSTIAELAPKIAIALGVVINSLLTAIASAIPKAEEVIGKLFGAFVRVINTQSGPIIGAGIKLLVNFLSGISQNITQVVQKASDIVVKFLNGLTANRARLTSAGLGAMLAFLGGISTGIPRIVAKVAEMVSKFLSAVTSRIPGIITKGAEMIISIARGIGSNIGKVVAAGVDVITKFMSGIGKAIPDLVAAGLRLARRFLNGIADGLSGLADVGFKAIIRFLNGIEKSIRNNSDDLFAAGAGIADALIDGLVGQFGKAGGALRSAIEGAMKLLPHWARKVLGIKSPSREFATIGQQTMSGFAVGVNEHRMHADKAVINAAHGAMQSFSKAVISRRTEPAAQFREVGRRSMQGLTQGLKDYRRPVVDAAGGIVNSMIATFKDVLQVRSPSRVMKDIGKNVGEGFAQGLHGSKDDIKSSFKSLRETLADEMRNERDQIKEENKKLRDLQEQQAEKLAELRDLQRHPTKNAEEIASTQKELKDIRSQIHESEVAISRYATNLRGATAAHSVLTKSLQDEKAKLIGLSKELESTTDNLEEAKGKLDDITKARQQFIDSTTEQYSKLPDEGQLLADALEVASQTAEEAAEKRKKKAEEDEKQRKINQVANYKKALAEQIAATKKYQETLQKLRELGLDDVTYRKLLAKGLEGQEFATQLAASGKGGIDELNKLDSELLAVSTGLAEQSAGNLYNAGVAAAQGLVDGLTARQAELKKAMDVLADSMVARIKYALGIRSPSQVFSEVGKFMVDGLAKGVQDNQNGVDSSIQSMAQNAVDAAKDSFGAIDMGSIMEVEPTITPVLDLTQVKKDAGQLSDLADVTPISAAASFRQAAAISDSQAAMATANAAAPQAAVNHVELTQNNYSPEALSDIEIYRQTNNQLAQVKNALGLGRTLYSAG